MTMLQSTFLAMLVLYSFELNQMEKKMTKLQH